MGDLWLINNIPGRLALVAAKPVKFYALSDRRYQIIALGHIIHTRVLLTRVML